MKLAIIDDRYDEVYGAQENVLLLAALCKEAGHQVTFLTTAEGRLSRAARDRGLEVVVELAPPTLLRFEREAIAGGLRQQVSTAVSMLRYSQRLHKVIRQLDVTVVVTSAVRPTLFMATTGLRRRPRIILYAQNSTPMGLFASLAGLVSWRIGLIGPGARTTFPRRLQRLLGRRFRPLPSGRDFERFDAERGTPPRSDGVLEILTVCSITRRKGIDVLIEALAAADLPPHRLTVVGGTTGPKAEAYLAELNHLVERLGSDVRFVGWHDDVMPFFDRADLFALASFDEGLPGVLLEAMAAGVACVTTRAGSAGDLVEGCHAGLAVDVGDVTALTEALEKLGSDDVLRRTHAELGHVQVREQFGLDAFYQAFIAIASEAESG